VPTRPFRDWNYADLHGAGALVGAAFSIVNPVRAWWGEGDEKIYVDDEAFPSTFGTGTEDYFGYAWCSPAKFTHAYHAQPRCDGPGNYGLTAVNRWHILDRVPFERRLRFDMELWHWTADARVTLAVVSYAYMRPGGSSAGEPLATADLAPPDVPPYRAQRVPNALEGEELRLVAWAGIAEAQDIGGTSNDRHLWWRECEPGDVLMLTFSAPRGGRYRVCLRRLLAQDYGVHAIGINGRPVMEALDSYSPELRLAEEFDLGVIELRAGENDLTVRVAGSNPAAAPAYMFGLDYLLLYSVD
jgi:hypothetical protein